LSASIAIAAIFQILMRQRMKRCSSSLTSPKLRRTGDFQPASEKYNSGRDRYFPRSPRISIQVRCDTQSLQSQMWANRVDLRQLPGDTSRVAAGGYDIDFLAWKLLRSDPRKDFADQAPITKYGTG